MNGSDTKSPRYLDVESVLRGEIILLPANTVLPTELQYARRFDVSRVTVRRALDMLERSGLITRQRGRGTIVSPPKIMRRFSPLFTFEHDLHDQGIEFETRVLAHDMEAIPPERMRKQLNLPEQSKVGFLSLLRLVDDRIICHDRRYFPPAVAKQLTPELIQRGNMSRVLEDLQGQRIATTDWESEIVPSASKPAAALEIAPGALIVENTFTYYLDDGTAIETGIMCYRIDRCKFKFGGRFNEPVLGAAGRLGTA